MTQSTQSVTGPSWSTSPAVSYHLRLLLEVPGLHVSIAVHGKDHIERTHRFREGRGCSFYECLGLEWFGSRSFFDQRKEATQAVWMDLALARLSGQELHNTYIITQSPEFAPLRRFFIAAVNQLLIVFDDLPVPSRQPSQSVATPLVETMRAAIDTCETASEDNVVLGSPPESSHAATIQVSTSPSVSSADDITPIVSIARRLTPANQSLRFLENGALGGRHDQNTYHPDRLYQVYVSRAHDYYCISTPCCWTSCHATRLQAYVPGLQLTGRIF